MDVTGVVNPESSVVEESAQQIGSEQLTLDERFSVEERLSDH